MTKLKRVSTEIRVDLDSNPYTPVAWKIRRHQRGGIVSVENRVNGLYVDGKKVCFFVHERQNVKKSSEHSLIKGWELIHELSDKAVLNYNMLHFLYKHPEYIPDTISKSKRIYFFGTIWWTDMSAPCGAPVVSYLSRGDNRMKEYDALEFEWCSNWVAAILDKT
jgi:hypothetical protein